MAKQPIFRGAGAALITPMNDDLSINYEKMEELIEKQIAGNTDALIIAGTTGESSTLSDEEHVEVIRFAKEKVRGRIPVIAGSGSNDTAYAVWLSQEAEKAGADGLLVVTPYYNKASQKGLFAHFKTVAKATKLPMILYNVPSRTGCNILPETAARLADTENIVGIKEASGNLSQIAQTAALCGDELPIYSGNDDQITAILGVGGVGVISVLSNICPRETHDICSLWFEGRVKESIGLQLRYLDLIHALFSDVNPIPVKQAMNYMNMQVGSCRMPLCDMEDASAIALLNVLKKYRLA